MNAQQTLTQRRAHFNQNSNNSINLILKVERCYKRFQSTVVATTEPEANEAGPARLSSPLLRQGAQFQWVLPWNLSPMPAPSFLVCGDVQDGDNNAALLIYGRRTLNWWCFRQQTLRMMAAAAFWQVRLVRAQCSDRLRALTPASPEDALSGGILRQRFMFGF